MCKAARVARRRGIPIVLDPVGAGIAELRRVPLAQERLSEITGEFTADDLLGVIFGRFCIGK